MIIREPQQHADIYDYAIWCGAWDAAENKPLRDIFFGVDNLAAEECRRLYELAYEIESQSYMLASTAHYTAEGTVYRWNDLHGCGKVGFDYDIVDFSYHVLLCEEVEAGDPVVLKYTYDTNGLKKIIEVQKKTLQPLYVKSSS